MSRNRTMTYIVLNTGSIRRKAVIRLDFTPLLQNISPQRMPDTKYTMNNNAAITNILYPPIIKIAATTQPLTATSQANRNHLFRLVSILL